VNQRFKSILLLVFDLRSFILAFAVFNFILVWIDTNHCMGGALVPARYCPWTYTNEPTILLVAAVFLRTNRWWGNIAALVLGGYLVGYFFYLLSIIYDPWQGLRNDWKTIRVDYPYNVGSWDSQYLLALIIFCCSGFFLTRSILRWRASRRTADNKSLDRSHGKQVSHQA
jgi:hypothetical protein